MQKVGNFRDQLNKGMLESAAKGSESIKEEVPEKTDVEDKPKNLEPPKKYKIPPKIKKPEPSKEIIKEEIFDSHKEENNSSIDKSQELKTNTPINSSNTIANKKEKLLTQFEPQANEKNLSFSEENCNSVVISDHNDLRLKDSHGFSKSSSDDKNLANSVHITENKLDPFTMLIQNSNDNTHNNCTSENSTKSQNNNFPVKKSHEQTSNNPKNLNEISIVSKTVNKNPLNTSIHSHKSTGDHKQQTQEKQIDIKSLISSEKTLERDELEDALETKTNILIKNLPSNPQTHPSSPKKENEVENFSDLMKNLDLLKKEIWELKHTKIAIQTSYEVEINKNHAYHYEIELLRKQINEFKVKEIKEGEAMLKLEIKCLSENILYHKKTNELLQKENESLKNEVKKLQEYITDIIEIKNLKDMTIKPIVKEKPNSKFFENEEEMEEPLLEREENQPENELDNIEEAVDNPYLPLEPMEKKTNEIIEDENRSQKDENFIYDENQQNQQENIFQKDEENDYEIYNIKATVTETENKAENISINEENERNPCFNYYFEKNENNHKEDEIEEKSNLEIISQSNLDYEMTQGTKENIIWDAIEEQNNIQIQSDNTSIKPFDEKVSSTLNEEEIFFHREQNQKDKQNIQILPDKKESSLSANQVKPKNLLKEENSDFKTPQNKTVHNIFDPTDDLNDDVFSSISNENIKPAAFKKVETTGSLPSTSVTVNLYQEN